MQVSELRAQFPILSRTVYGKKLVYLDNAATAQRPLSVVDLQRESALEANANLHRAVHSLAGEATEIFEDTRRAVQAFLHASAPEEIVFTAGATAAINLVAFSFGEAFVKEADEVLVTVAEHHSNLLPWQMLCARKKAVLKVLDICENGGLDIESLQKSLSQRTKIVAISHISNVLGLVNPVREIVRICHEKRIPVLVDGAQGVVHAPVDVQEMDCDFYVFSGHKVYAATGTGVLYGKRKWLELMPPYMGGGEMIESVSLSGFKPAPLPAKFEAGTQNINGIPTLKPALELALQMRDDKEIQAEQKAIFDYVYDRLMQDDRIVLYGTDRANKVPLFSFAVKGAHHEDLALILDKMGVALRSGQMCAEPLMDRLGVTGLLRASFAPYNTLEEAKFFIESLDKAIGMLV
ncbi:MAG: SufS family cysteine desulfurase [Bacteroidales bacterium]|nr:SufS family cysteine desulfurase [Bacteroidales bacterium]